MQLNEYQFQYGDNLILDVQASSRAEAVQLANADLHLLDKVEITPPGVFMRVKIEYGVPLTDADIVNVIELEDALDGKQE